MELYRAAVVSGIATGGVYALVAVGITQMFKVTRVLNFAHAGFVLWGAYLYAFFSVSKGWPALPSAVLAVAAVTAMGVVSELIVFRFARRASLVQRLIITIGLLQALTALAAWIFSTKTRVGAEIVGDGGFSLLGTRVTWEQSANLGVALGVVLLLGAYLKYTRWGLLTRATAEDATMAQIIGSPLGRVGMLNWGIGAGIGGVAGVLIAASGQPFLNTTFVYVFVLALTATVFAGLHSLGWTLAGALIIGVLRSVAAVRFNQPGVPELCVFLLLVAAVIFRRSWAAEVTKVAWSPTSRLTDGVPFWRIERGLILLGWIALVYAAFGSAVWAQTASLVLVYAMTGLSLVPIVGWTGQISLAQGGFMGIGVYTMSLFFDHHELPFGLAIALGVVAGAVAGILVGLVVQRMPFVLTAVVTLAFTAATTGWLLYTDWFHTQSGRVSIFLGEPLDSEWRRVVGFGLVIAVTMWILWNLRRSQWGVRFYAVRTSPQMARHFGISPSRVRVYAYALSGGIAAMAGMMHFFIVSTALPETYGLNMSLQVLIFAVAGGVTAIYGPLIGSIAFVAVPQWLGVAKWGVAELPVLVGGAATVQLMATFDDGLVSLTRPPSDSSSSAGSPVSESGMGDGSASGVGPDIDVAARPVAD